MFCHSLRAFSAHYCVGQAGRLHTYCLVLFEINFGVSGCSVQRLGLFFCFRFVNLRLQIALFCVSLRAFSLQCAGQAEPDNTNCFFLVGIHCGVSGCSVSESIDCRGAAMAVSRLRWYVCGVGALLFCFALCTGVCRPIAAKPSRRLLLARRGTRFPLRF